MQIGIRCSLARCRIAAWVCSLSALPQLWKSKPYPVKGEWLVVYRLVIGDDGIPETHIYRRVMTPQGLGLRFSAIRDGKEVRTVTGRYRKR